MRVTRIASATLAACMTVTASAAITATNFQPAGPFAGFPLQNPAAPTGPAYQSNYPYPGQCVADAANAKLFPTLPLCSARATTSFTCTSAGHSNRSADAWAGCGAPVPFVEVAPVASTGQLKFAWEVLNPPDYTPDTATFPGADYYDIGLHEAWGFQTLAGLGAFPNPKAGRCSLSGALCDPAAGAGACPATAGVCGAIFPAAVPPVPNGMQWTGLMCQPVAPATSCSCPSDMAAALKATHCPGGVIPAGWPLYTPIWGVGQRNMGGTLGVGTRSPGAGWGSNSYIATWPSISIRGTKGKPVVVKWTNEFPNNHVLCPHPDAADWPCSIDRTFMGVKARIDPATALTDPATGKFFVPPDGVNVYGSPQQPDNSWVTHLHGGEIPPSTDGFAEKWFGNSITGPLYTPAHGKFVNPPFENPSAIELKRPGGNFDTYTYPMVQEEATIWFHDHTLGKTHHNVIAGPAGFFPVKEPLKHGAVTAGKCTAAAGQTCEYTWLDPVTEPRGAFGMPKYDLFLAIQDRAFNDDGSINFSNGLGQTVVQPPVAPLVPGNTSITPGVNPLVHPTWIPEYFGDHALVNGVLWPKKTAEAGWYRLRLVDGSDSRCWTIGFSTVQPMRGTKPKNDVDFYVIANDQGYLKTPVLAPGGQVTMCPGERYELLVDFSKIANLPANSAATVFMTNTAAAPFPAGITPFAAASPFADLNVVMRFDVSPANGAGVKSCGMAGAPASLTWDPARTAAANAATACMPPNPSLAIPVGVPTTTDPNYADLRPTVFPVAPGTTAFNDRKTLPTIVRQVYLNERLDGLTLAPLGMQLNGVPFEYKVTETPRFGTREIWQFVNLTVDAHPLHPHLVRHQIVARQTFNVGKYKALLCGSTTCQPGTSPGGEMQLIPDPSVALSGAPVLVTPASVEGGNKDAVQVPPGKVSTIVADWTARWPVSATPNAPGTAGCPNGTTGCRAPYTYEPVTSGPYVWHCHINSHEDSEMMRTSLVVP